MRSAGKGRNITRLTTGSEHHEIDDAYLETPRRPQMIGYRLGVRDNRALSEDHPVGVTHAVPNRAFVATSGKRSVFTERPLC
jgi:hypothetical protein